MQEITKYYEMIEKFANDLSLEKAQVEDGEEFPNEFNISKLIRDKKKNQEILEDIELLDELAGRFRYNELKIVEC